MTLKHTSGTNNRNKLFLIKFNQTKATANNFIVYPNPSANEFSMLTGQPETVKLYDLTGKLLDTFFVNENEVFVYRHDLPQGVYVVKVKECGVMRKIIVR